MDERPTAKAYRYDILNNERVESSWPHGCACGGKLDLNRVVPLHEKANYAWEYDKDVDCS